MFPLGKFNGTLSLPAFLFASFFLFTFAGIFYLISHFASSMFCYCLSLVLLLAYSFDTFTQTIHTQQYF